MAGELLVASAAIYNSQGHLLLARRAYGGRIRDCWELPGGKVEAGERIHQAVVREIREELGVEIELRKAIGQWCLGPPASVVDAAAAMGRAPLMQVLWAASIVSGRPRCHRGIHSEVEWVTPEQVLRELPDGRRWCPDQRDAIAAAAQYSLEQARRRAAEAVRARVLGWHSLAPST